MASKITLYTVAGSPPGFAVRLVLKYLEIPHSIKNVDYFTGEHFSESYLKVALCNLTFYLIFYKVRKSIYVFNGFNLIPRCILKESCQL